MFWRSVGMILVVLFVISIPYITVKILKHKGDIEIEWQFYSLGGKSCYTLNNTLYMPVEFQITNHFNLDYIFSNIRLELFDGDTKIIELSEMNKCIDNSEALVKKTCIHQNFLVGGNSFLKIKRVFSLELDFEIKDTLNVFYAYNDLRGRKVRKLVGNLATLMK